jgi:RHS repeat-associated protein
LTDYSGQAYEFVLYLPWGQELAQQKVAGYSTPYRFTSKELDSETGLYYYGARYYDPMVGQFFGVDPMADKHSGVGPFSYCFNNPIIILDPDGREGIVISGQPGGHGNKEHFLANGLDRASKALGKRKSNSEKVTWIVYNDGSKEHGHNPEMIKEYKAKAKQLGITLKEVKTVDAIVDYVNNKDGGTSRKDDKVTSFYYSGHAKPGNLNPGYPKSDGALDPDNFSDDAFSSGVWINVVGGCRTDVDQSWIFDDSVVDKFQRKVDDKSTINGSNVKTQYDGGVRTDEQILKENEGKIITVKGTKKDD